MLQERQVYIEELNNFIFSSKSKLNHILEVLDWSKESIYSACQVIKNVDVSGTVGINKASNKEDLPTGDGNKPDEKSLVGVNNMSIGSEPLYKELVESLSKQPLGKIEKKNEKEILLEMLKMERDAKRRRINYKNRVHTKNKSHIEIIREVIAEQMSTLTEHSQDNSSVSRKEDVNLNINQSDDLIEIELPRGNHFLAWKSILKTEPSDQHTEDIMMKTKPQDKHSSVDTSLRNEEINNRFKKHREHSRSSFDDSCYNTDGKQSYPRRQFSNQNSKYNNDNSSDRKYYSNRKKKSTDSKFERDKYYRRRSISQQRDSRSYENNSRSNNYNKRSDSKYHKGQNSEDSSISSESNSESEEDKERKYKRDKRSKYDNRSNISSRRKRDSNHRDEKYKSSSKSKRDSSDSDSSYSPKRKYRKSNHKEYFCSKKEKTRKGKHK